MWNIQPEHRRLDRQRLLDGRRDFKKDSNDPFFLGGGGRNRVGGAGGCVAQVNTRIHDFSFSLLGAQFHSSVVEDCNCKINFCLFLNSPFKLFLFLRMYLKE